MSANYVQGIMNVCFLFPPKTYCFDQLATACLLMWLRVDIIHMGMSFLVLLLGKYSRPLVRRIGSRVRTHTHTPFPHGYQNQVPYIKWHRTVDSPYLQVQPTAAQNPWMGNLQIGRAECSMTSWNDNSLLNQTNTECSSFLFLKPGPRYTHICFIILYTYLFIVCVFFY